MKTFGGDGVVVMPAFVLEKIPQAIKLVTRLRLHERVDCRGVVQHVVEIIREDDVVRGNIHLAHRLENFIEKFALPVLENQNEIPIAAHDNFCLVGVIGAQRPNNFHIAFQKIFCPLSTFARVIPQHHFEHLITFPKNFFNS